MPPALATDHTQRPAQAVSFLQHLVGIIDRPQATLDAIYARPRWSWLAPIVLTLVAGVLLNLVSLPYSLDAAVAEVQRQLRSMPEEQAALVAAQADRFTTPAFLLVSGAALQLASVFIGVLSSTAILYFIGLIRGTELTFAPLFSVVAWTWIPFAIRDLVEAGYVYLQKGMVVNRGLSWFVSVGDPAKDGASFIYFILSYVQIFVLWHLLLVWAALRGTTKISGASAAFVVVIYSIVGLVLRWIPMAIGRAFGGVG